MTLLPIRRSRIRNTPPPTSARPGARRLLAALLAPACLWPAALFKPARAQEAPPPVRLEAENAELRRRLEELEGRVKELEEEARRSRPKGPPGEVAPQVGNGRSIPPAPGAAPPPAADSSARPASDESGESSLGNFFKQTRLSGYLDAYYGFNFNRPASRLNAYRSFDARHDEFAFSAAELAFEKPPSESSRVGFRLDLLFGPAADFLSSTEPGGVEVYKHVQQAYGSYLAPVGRGLQLDFGKFVSWSGAEVDESADNWNYSRGLLYTLAQPAYHAGARAAYAFGERLSLTGAVVNGWGNVEENNGGKTFGLSVEYNPTEKFSLTQNYTGGPEQPGDEGRWRHFFDTVVSYELGRRVQLLGNYDYGFERLAGGTKIRWQGAAAYLRYAPAARFALSPRFEWYSDPDGYTSGTPQTLRELTLTGEYKLRGGLLSRVEYRRDWSNRAVFETADSSVASKRQTTLLGGFTWSFSAGAEEDSSGGEAAPGDADSPPRAKPASAGASARNFPPRAAPFAESFKRANAPKLFAGSASGVSDQPEGSAKTIQESKTRGARVGVRKFGESGWGDKLPPPSR